MTENTPTPVMNENFYRRNETIAFKNSLYSRSIREAVINILPRDTVEFYVNCFPRNFDNFVNSVGIVPGVINLFMIMLFLIIIPGFYGITWLTNGIRPISPAEAENKDTKAVVEVVLQMKRDLLKCMEYNITLCKSMEKTTWEMSEKERLMKQADETEAEAEYLKEEIAWITKTLANGAEARYVYSAIAQAGSVVDAVEVAEEILDVEDEVE